MIVKALHFVGGVICGGIAMAIVAAFWAYDKWWQKPYRLPGQG